MSSANGAIYYSLGQRPRWPAPRHGAPAPSANGAIYYSLGQRPRGGNVAMPQSLANVVIHLVFSAKDRREYFRSPIRDELHVYLATVARNAGCDGSRVGGAADHVHVAVRLGRTLTIAGLVEELKTSSSKWLKTLSPELGDFAWQRGYAAFSVAPADYEALVAYIDDQEEHHRKHTFCAEYRSFLKKYGISFDERYVWD